MQQPPLPALSGAPSAAQLEPAQPAPARPSTQPAAPPEAAAAPAAAATATGRAMGRATGRAKGASGYTGVYLQQSNATVPSYRIEVHMRLGGGHRQRLTAGGWRAAGDAATARDFALIWAHLHSGGGADGVRGLLLNFPPETYLEIPGLLELFQGQSYEELQRYLRQDAIDSRSCEGGAEPGHSWGACSTEEGGAEAEPSSVGPSSSGGGSGAAAATAAATAAAGAAATMPRAGEAVAAATVETTLQGEAAAGSPAEAGAQSTAQQSTAAAGGDNYRAFIDSALGLGARDCRPQAGDSEQPAAKRPKLQPAPAASPAPVSSPGMTAAPPANLAGAAAQQGGTAGAAGAAGAAARSSQAGSTPSSTSHPPAGSKESLDLVLARLSRLHGWSTPNSFRVLEDGAVEKRVQANYFKCGQREFNLPADVLRLLFGVHTGKVALEGTIPPAAGAPLPASAFPALPSEGASARRQRWPSRISGTGTNNSIVVPRGAAEAFGVLPGCTLRFRHAGSWQGLPLASVEVVPGSGLQPQQQAVASVAQVRAAAGQATQQQQQQQEEEAEERRQRKGHISGQRPSQQQEEQELHPSGRPARQGSAGLFPVDTGGDSGSALTAAAAGDGGVAVPADSCGESRGQQPAAAPQLPPQQAEQQQQGEQQQQVIWGDAQPAGAAATEPTHAASTDVAPAGAAPAPAPAGPSSDIDAPAGPPGAPPSAGALPREVWDATGAAEVGMRKRLDLVAAWTRLDLPMKEVLHWAILAAWNLRDAGQVATLVESALAAGRAPG